MLLNYCTYSVDFYTVKTLRHCMVIAMIASKSLKVSSVFFFVFCSTLCEFQHAMTSVYTGSPSTWLQYLYTSYERHVNNATQAPKIW